MTLMGHRGRSVRSWPTPRASPNWDVQPKAAPRWTASRSPQGGRPTRRSATRAAERSESSLRPMGGVVIELALWRRLAAELLGSAFLAAFGGVSWRTAAAYLPAQVAGCIGGAVVRWLLSSCPQRPPSASRPVTVPL